MGHCRTKQVRAGLKPPGAAHPPRGVNVAGISVPENEGGRFGAFVATARQRTTDFVRDRRRKRAAKGRKRGVSRALLALLAILFALFFWALSSIFSAPTPGSKLSLDELSTLAHNGRIATATFLDVDNRITGTYVAGSGITGADRNLSPTSPVNVPSAAGEFYADVPSSASLTSALQAELVNGQAMVT